MWPRTKIVRPAASGPRTKIVRPAPPARHRRRMPPRRDRTRGARSRAPPKKPLRFRCVESRKVYRYRYSGQVTGKVLYRLPRSLFTGVSFYRCSTGNVAKRE